MRQLTSPEEFWPRVNKSDTCWLWAGARNRDGYGVIRGELAHRVALRLSGIEVPEGLESDHLCKNRLCVRPDHIEFVTHQVNSARARKTHCKWGHPSEGNRNKLGQCITCKRQQARDRYHKSVNQTPGHR